MFSPHVRESEGHSECRRNPIEMTKTEMQNSENNAFPTKTIRKPASKRASWGEKIADSTGLQCSALLGS